jgi:hypothetical protein
MKESASRLLDGADPLVARLQSKPSGHDGLSFAGGEQFLAIGLTCGGDLAAGTCWAERDEGRAGPAEEKKESWAPGR